MEWAKAMIWKGLEPVVEELETFYKKGVSNDVEQFMPFMPFHSRIFQ